VKTTTTTTKKKRNLGVEDYL